jgi:hypothetical protein
VVTIVIGAVSVAAMSSNAVMTSILPRARRRETASSHDGTSGGRTASRDVRRA